MAITQRLSLGLTLLVAAAPCGGARAASSACEATRCVNLLLDGDSISAGVGASKGHHLDTLIAAAIGNAAQVHNVAVGGRPVSECLRLYGQLVAPLFDPHAQYNVIVFHAGDNDIAQGRDSAQTYTAFTAYVATAHQEGWKVVVSTELRHADFSPERESQLEDYNDRLRRNTAGADAVVDLDKDARLHDFSYRHDPALFTRDGVHPSDEGYEILAAMLAPQVRQAAGR